MMAINGDEIIKARDVSITGYVARPAQYLP
jgi:hypothetical protein